LVTSVRPRPQPPKPPKHASAREIIKRATVPVLCYHQLRNWTSSDSQYNRVNLICPPKNFHAHLDALAENGWTTISPGHYLRHLTTGAALPPKPAMLSFDDGTAGQAHEGLAQLTRRGMTGTFFVMTARPPSSSRPRNSTAQHRSTPCTGPSSSQPGAAQRCSST
jgi:peptidoglycan/xylan/chitin deacetylase (PgdA/CDA1 family)